MSGGGNFRSGSTPYDKLTIAVKFADGIATAEDIRVEGPAAHLTLTGTASVPTREYDMKGVASLNTPPGGAPGFDLPFVVQGPWDDPLIFPDPESLIRRSPASAPCSTRSRTARPAMPCGRCWSGLPVAAQKPAAAPDAAAAAPASARRRRSAPAAQTEKQN